MKRTIAGYQDIVAVAVIMDDQDQILWTLIPLRSIPACTLGRCACNKRSRKGRSL
jgi:hypothetical protein